VYMDVYIRTYTRVRLIREGARSHFAVVPLA
jgi:hypothetical protein